MPTRCWKEISVFCLLGLTGVADTAGIKSAQWLTVGEGFTNPIGFHDATPTFSWKLPEGVKGQTAYQIEVRSDEGVWDSGRMESRQSVRVPYGGPALRSGQRMEWRVRFCDEEGSTSDWSAPAHVELGLLQNADWKGSWIRMADRTVSQDPASPVLIEIDEALYGISDHPQKQVDMAGKLRRQVATGNLVVAANNAFAGKDPAPGSAKTLRIAYRINGEPCQIEVRENDLLDLVSGKTRGEGALFVPEYLRREFAVGGEVARARLHVTAKGLYEMYLNGERVGGDYLVPGWTPYNQRIETLTYDVTDQLRRGKNTLGAILGEGWYAGDIKGKRISYPDLRPVLLVQLEIAYSNGESETLVSDDRWKATNEGPIRYSSIYHGEDYDARREMPGWNRTGFDDSGWVGVVTEKVGPKPVLAPKQHQPVRITRELPTLRLTEPSPGRFVFDLGQNMVGWPRLAIPVKKGQAISVRVAEMLKEDGNLYTANYRTARSKDTYVAAETGEINWQPTFTFHGCRYVELSGFPEDTTPQPGWVTGVVLHSDLEQTGRFESSHEKLNRLQENIVWGQRGNFLDIPTDCPQRSERLGWTGDAQVFCATALFNYDCHAFFKSWLTSMREEQLPDGRIPHYIPTTSGAGGSPGWMDAATIIPWEVYVRTGDMEVLAENFGMMERLVGWYRNQSTNGLIPTIGGFGDWLQPYSKQNAGDTSKPLLGTAFYARSAHILADAARVLERADHAKRYAREALFVKKAFAEHYFDTEGRLRNAPETQTAYLLALAFDLVPDGLRDAVEKQLVVQIRAAGNHLRTGFLGTPHITWELDSAGYAGMAFDVLFKETYPSWFFSINQGATTMWERWNSYSREDGFGPVGMNSFNHYAYGAIGQWMYERIAGLAPDPEQPGYRHFFVRPLTGGPLSFARAELETPYGRASSSWAKQGGKLVLDVTVPPNTTATIEFPNGRKPETVSAGIYRYEVDVN